MNGASEFLGMSSGTRASTPVGGRGRRYRWVSPSSRGHRPVAGLRVVEPERPSPAIPEQLARALAWPPATATGRHPEARDAATVILLRDGPDGVECSQRRINRMTLRAGHARLPRWPGLRSQTPSWLGADLPTSRSR